MLSVEVLLQYQLAVACDKHAVDLLVMNGLHRSVDDALHHLLDGGAVDVDLLESTGRPAIVARQRRALIRVGRRISATRIEVTLPDFARELVLSPAAGEVDGEDRVLRIVGT